MDKEIAEKYIKAGKILKEVQKNAKKSIKPGKKLLEIAENIEKEIQTLGGLPAFPVNLSLDNKAAHYTPGADDKTEISEKSVLKVDIGVHVDGYIADAAFTIDFSNEHGKMVEANEEALQAALAVVKEGAKLQDIGKAISSVVKKHGFNVVQNLSGHGLQRWDAHAFPNIPNIEKRDERIIEEGMVFAIEPFVTNGEGYVREDAQTEIFKFEKFAPLRNLEARQILEFVEKNYKTLPFAERWIIEKLKIPEFKRKIAFRELLKSGCLHPFPVLKEREGKIVTQTETSVMINNGEVIILV